MSAARWCDYADHAFAGGRPGTIVMGQLVQNDPRRSRYDPGPEVEQEVREMCPECAAALGLLQDYEAPVTPQERKMAMLEGIKEAAKESTKKGK